MLSWFGALTVAAVFTVVALSWPQLRAIEQLVEMPSSHAVDTSALAPSNHKNHFLVGWLTATILLILGIGWLFCLSVLKNRTPPETAISMVRVVGVTGLFVIAALVAVPWRIVWDNERELIDFDGRPAFVVTESDTRLYLYAPRSDERFLEVTSDDPRVKRMRGARKENIFNQRQEPEQ